MEKRARKLAKKEKKVEGKANEEAEMMAQGTRKDEKVMPKEAARANNREPSLDSYDEEAWTDQTTTERWDSVVDLKLDREWQRTEHDEVLAAMWPLMRYPRRG